MGISFPTDGKRPAHIARNPILRRVWTLTHTKKQNANFIFMGGVGAGKTWAAIFWGYVLDPDFSMERVVFTIQDFLKLLDEGDSKGKLGKGSVVIFDEIAGSEEGADARSFMSKSNKTFSFLVTTFRVRGLIVFYTAPMLSQIDANVRKVGIKGIAKFYEKNIDYVTKKNVAEFQWVYTDSESGTSYKPKPQISLSKDGWQTAKIIGIGIPRPPLKLIHQYEKKKAAFLAENIKKWRKLLEKEEGGSNEPSFKELYHKVKKNIRSYISPTGRLQWELIRVEYDLSHSVAQALKSKLEKDLPSDIEALRTQNTGVRGIKGRAQSV